MEFYCGLLISSDTRVVVTQTCWGCSFQTWACDGVRTVSPGTTQFTNVVRLGGTCEICSSNTKLAEIGWGKGGHFSGVVMTAVAEPWSFPCRCWNHTRVLQICATNRTLVLAVSNLRKQKEREGQNIELDTGGLSKTQQVLFVQILYARGRFLVCRELKPHD